MLNLNTRTRSASVPTKVIGLPKSAAPSPRKPISTTSSKPVKRKFSWKRVAVGVVGGFLILVAILYVLGNPLARSSVNFILGRNQPAKFVYEPSSIAFGTDIAPELRTKFTEKLSQVTYEGTKKFSFTDNTSEADFIITSISGHESKDETIKTIYKSYLVPVGHMYWVRDTINREDLKNVEIATTVSFESIANKVLSESLGKEIKVKAQENLPNYLGQGENRSGIIDISELDRNYKLLELDNKYFLDTAPDGAIPYSITVKREKAKKFSGSDVISYWVQQALAVEFHKDDVLKVNMTGVTAISRGLAIRTNNAKNGGYAADKIGAFLADADLTHTSNEVSFVDGCSPAGSTMRFCSHPSYIEALEKSGIDIVELTGNHNNDYGATWNAKTIETYKQKGWDYFGGGLNSTDAAKILYKDMKDTKLAFVGYDYYDTILGTGALAGANRAGANSWSVEKVKNDVKTARENGADVVIVTIQYQECWAYTTGNTICYSPIASPNQSKDFRAAADAGADIVIGTQAHQPQTYEIYNGKAIFYGLGNLFFDQVQWLGTRQGLVLTHYFYKGTYMTTKLSTTIYDSDMKTYVTNGTERTRLLNQLKAGRR
jgi:poly-gamma-glutamate synthesis protein (capsule biosynthesis protein)